MTPDSIVTHRHFLDPKTVGGVFKRHSLSRDLLVLHYASTYREGNSSEAPFPFNIPLAFTLSVHNHKPWRDSDGTLPCQVVAPQVANSLSSPEFSKSPTRFS